jgi:hypothetical protein
MIRFFGEIGFARYFWIDLIRDSTENTDTAASVLRDK